MKADIADFAPEAKKEYRTAVCHHDCIANQVQESHAADLRGRTVAERRGAQEANLISFIHPLDRIPDILHKFVRVFERVLADILQPALEHGADGDQARIVVTDAFRQCHIPHFSFRLKYEKDAQGNPTGKGKWRHSKLQGPQLQLIMRHLDLSKFLEGRALDATRLLWALLDRINVMLRVPVGHELYPESPEHYRELAVDFVRLWTLIGGSGVTAYMHDDVDHIPDMLRRHGTIFQYSTSEIERLHKEENRILEHHTMGLKDIMECMIDIMQHSIRMNAALRYHSYRTHRDYVMVKRQAASTGTGWKLRSDTLELLGGSAYRELIDRLDREVKKKRKEREDLVDPSAKR